MRLPDRVTGLSITPEGKARGLPLPSLDERGAGEAWRAHLGRGAYLLHFEDRAADADLDWLQRLHRLGEVWLDAPVRDIDAALDLLVAGVHRLVLRPGSDDDILDAVADSAVVAWEDGDHATPTATARRIDAPLLALRPLPPEATEAGPASPGETVAPGVAASLPQMLAPGPNGASAEPRPSAAPAAATAAMAFALYQAPALPWARPVHIEHVGHHGDGDGE